MWLGDARGARDVQNPPHEETSSEDSAAAAPSELSTEDDEDCREGAMEEDSQEEEDADEPTLLKRAVERSYQRGIGTPARPHQVQLSFAPLL